MHRRAVKGASFLVMAWISGGAVARAEISRADIEAERRRVDALRALLTRESAALTDGEPQELGLRINRSFFDALNTELQAVPEEARTVRFEIRSGSGALSV